MGHLQVGEVLEARLHVGDAAVGAERDEVAGSFQEPAEIEPGTERAPPARGIWGSLCGRPLPPAEMLLLARSVLRRIWKRLSLSTKAEQKRAAA